MWVNVSRKSSALRTLVLPSRPINEKILLERIRWFPARWLVLRVVLLRPFMMLTTLGCRTGELRNFRTMLPCLVSASANGVSASSVPIVLCRPFILVELLDRLCSRAMTLPTPLASLGLCRRIVADTDVSVVSVGVPVRTIVRDLWILGLLSTVCKVLALAGTLVVATRNVFFVS